MKNYFKKYVSNTLASTQNQLYFVSDGTKQKGRVYYKAFCSGEYEYSFLFCDTIDSTYAGGDISRVNEACGGWTIHSATAIVCDVNGEEKAVNLTFNRKEEKLVSFIERYCDRSPRLKLERVDTSKDTEFRSKYGFNDSANLSYCIVVESEKRNRIISADELFVWYNASYPDLGYMSAATLQYRISALESMLAQNSAYYSQMSESDKEQYNSYMTMYQSLYYMSARYLDAQNVISQAIDYVTADVIPTFYFATGHGEKNTTSGPLDLTR